MFSIFHTITILNKKKGLAKSSGLSVDFLPRLDDFRTFLTRDGNVAHQKDRGPELGLFEDLSAF